MNKCAVISNTKSCEISRKSTCKKNVEIQIQNSIKKVIQTEKEKSN